MTLEQLVKEDRLGTGLEYYNGDLEGQCSEYTGLVKEGKWSCMGDLQTLQGDEYRGSFNGQ